MHILETLLTEVNINNCLDLFKTVTFFLVTCECVLYFCPTKQYQYNNIELMFVGINIFLAPLKLVKMSSDFLDNLYNIYCVFTHKLGLYIR